MAQLTQFAHAHEEKEWLRQQTISNRRRMDEGDVEAARLVNGTARLQQTQTTTNTTTATRSFAIPPTQKPTSFETYFSMRARENSKRFEAEQQFTKLLAGREKLENSKYYVNNYSRNIARNVNKTSMAIDFPLNFQ